MKISQKPISVALKSFDNSGAFAGYASVFDVVDAQNDIVVRGSFEKTIRKRKGSIKLLWQHQMDEPIGIITRLFEDRRGLFVEGKLLLHVARAREAYALLKSGALSGISIGYTPVRTAIDAKGIRRIFEADLWEISLVTFPANEQAQVTVVKSTSWPEFAKQTIGPSMRPQDGSPYDSASRNSGDDWKCARHNGQLIELSDAVARLRQVISVS